MEFMKSVDGWFLILAVVLLGGYFLWSVKGMVGDIKSSLVKLENFIGRLFDKFNNHEARLRVLESKCFGAGFRPPECQDSHESSGD